MLKTKLLGITGVDLGITDDYYVGILNLSVGERICTTGEVFNNSVTVFSTPMKIG